MNNDLVLLNFDNVQEAAEEMELIGCDPSGIRIMSPKAVFKAIRIGGLRSKAANLLKQAFLSQGGDVAIARGCADLSAPYTDVLIMATVQQYKIVIPKLRLQPWGLDKLADDLEEALCSIGDFPRRKC